MEVQSLSHIEDFFSSYKLDDTAIPYLPLPMVQNVKPWKK
jgi:hypothetical protein